MSTYNAKTIDRQITLTYLYKIKVKALMQVAIGVKMKCARCKNSFYVLTNFCNDKFTTALFYRTSRISHISLPFKKCALELIADNS